MVIADLRHLVSGLCALLFALSIPAQAQQPGKMARIGLSVPGTQAAFAKRLEAFRQGLRELGYMETVAKLLEGK